MTSAILAAALFSATFDGIPLRVEEARCSAFPMNQVWPGYERPASQSRLDAFVNFDVLRPGEFAVALPNECAPGDVTLSPYSCDKLRIEDGKAKLGIDGPGNYVLEFGEGRPKLHVFANPPFVYEHAEDEIYFGPGVHEAGLIEPKSGQTVCIDAGAIVYGAIYLDHVTNVTITGRGVLDSSRIRRVNRDGCYLRTLTEEERRRLYDVTQFTCIASENVRVSGIVLRDSPFWTMIVRARSRNVEIDGVHIVGQWRYNSDGIDICGCENVAIRNSFIRSFDDAIALRDGGLEHGTTPVPSRDIVCENCLLWSDWGSNFKAQIGGTRDALIERVSVTNCVFSHIDTGGVILAARPGGPNGIVRDILIENIEYDFPARRYGHQWHRKEVYDDVFMPRQIGHAKLFEICNYGYRPQDVKNIELTFDRITFRNLRQIGPCGRLEAVVRIEAARECVRDLVVEDVPENLVWRRSATFSQSASAEVVEDIQYSGRTNLTARGTMLVDFGKAAFGGVEVDFGKGEYEILIGEKLDAQGGVDLNPGGTIRAARVRGVSSGRGFERVPLVADERNTKGADRSAVACRIPEAFGVVMPFRYVEIVRLPGDAAQANIRRTVLHWPIDMSASSFSCSSERLKKVYDFCKYSIWATSFAGLYVDGDRERIPYEADAYVNQLCHYAVDADFEMGRRTFAHLMEHPTWPTEWAQHMIMMAWADWMYSGSTDLVSRYYDRLKDEKLLLGLAREDGLLVSFPDHSRPDQGDIVDWPVCERDGFVFKPVNAVVNAFHYRNLNEMRDIAAALGKTADAAFFAERAACVKASFGRVFFRDATGLYADGEGTDHASLHANAAALAFGLVPEEQKDCVADFLVSRGMACSVYFAQYLLEALFEAGRDEAAIALMKSTSDRSWLGMMAQGSTVTMEAWNAAVKPNLDWNHAWGAVPLNIISRYILGVRPTSPGFATYQVSPTKARMKFSGVVPTVRGPIAVESPAQEGER